MTDTAAVEATKETGLITVPAKETILEVFKSDGGLDPYLAEIRKEVDAFLANPPGVDTAKGRKQYASMGNKIARSKTAIDGLGKELVAELKELPKKIDASRKQWRDTLDEWKAEVTQPATEWKADDDARIADLQAKVAWLNDQWQTGLDDLDAAQIQSRLDAVQAFDTSQLEEFTEMGVMAKSMAMTTLPPRVAKQLKAEAEAKELERLRAEAEEQKRQAERQRIEQEAAERARREAEQAAADKIEQQQREHEAALAEADRKARELEEAHKRAQEQDRLAAEQEAARLAKVEADAKAEDERRAADKAHRGRINRTAADALIERGLPESDARHVITLIAQGKVPGVTINY